MFLVNCGLGLVLVNLISVKMINTSRASVFVLDNWDYFLYTVITYLTVGLMNKKEATAPSCVHKTHS